ncbi:MAG: hypothetical protein V1779_00140 [bacterium]
MWLEVFKSGEHKDSSGKLRKFTDDMLDKIAALYNGKVKESSSYEAPLVKGHPKTDDPAYGWIKTLKRKGNTLLAKLKDVSNDLVDEVKKGLFKKISIALYPDLMLRHVGLLGASAPAVKGLRNVEFDESEEFNELIIDNSQLTIEGEGKKEKGEGSLITNDELLITNENGMTEGRKDRMTEGRNDGKTESKANSSFDKLRMTDERICELEDENRELRMRKDELERGIRINEYREFVNSLIEFEGGGIITPAQGEELVDILILIDSDDLEFNERRNDGKTEGQKDRKTGERKNTMVERLIALFNGMKPRVSGDLFSDSFTADSRRQTADGKVNMNIETDFSKIGNINLDRLELHRKAQELQLKNSCLTYEEAVNHALSL